MIKILEKKDVKDLLKNTLNEWDTYVPMKKDGGDIWVEPLSKGSKDIEKALENIVLGDDDIVVSQKDVFFPQVSPLFKFKDGEIKETIEFSPKLLFGVKPCDLKGILFVDEFFKRDIEDTYYLSRIKDRLIVVLGCLNPPREDACFCTSTGTGPFLDEEFDVQLIDNGDSYFVQEASEKGKAFISNYSKFFQDASDDAEKQIEQIKSKAKESVKLKVGFDKAVDLMKQDNFIPDDKYKDIAERCIYCGGCVYVCPTCTCFNVFDNIKDKEGVRCRNWDACMFEGYTREATGHNPRQDKGIRASRRYEHKLKYDKKVTGQSGCVGCGRCLTSCPVELGMSKFIKDITG